MGRELFWVFTPPSPPPSPFPPPPAPSSSTLHPCSDGNWNDASMWCDNTLPEPTDTVKLSCNGFGPCQITANIGVMIHKLEVTDPTVTLRVTNSLDVVEGPITIPTLVIDCELWLSFFFCLRMGHLFVLLTPRQFSSPLRSERRLPCHRDGDSVDAL